MTKIIQSGGFLGKILGNMMSNLGKKVLIGLAALFAKVILPKLATKATSSVFDKFERKISAQGAIATDRAGAVRTKRGLTFPFVLLKQ